MTTTAPLHKFTDIFYVVGRERGHVSREGTRLEMRIRTTRVFRFRRPALAQIHHHGSIEDRALLAAYQNAVRQDSAIAGAGRSRHDQR